MAHVLHLLIKDLYLIELWSPYATEKKIKNIKSIGMERDRQYLEMPSMQQRPITLGELLAREENIDLTETTPQRSMGRTMSPTRCLGSLANGRPRRARARTLTRPSTSADLDDDSSSESFEPLRRRHQSSAPLAMPDLMQWRHATAEARVRNFFHLINEPQDSGLRGTSTATRPRHRNISGLLDSSDLLFNPFSWQRRSSGGSRHTRRRTSDSASRANLILQRRPSIGHSTRRVPRIIDVYDSRIVPRGSPYRYLRAGRPRTTRARTEASGSGDAANNTSGNQEDVSAFMRRFINFTAEFIPVRERPPNAEPPEWSLNITAADLGPFAIGRSALSRARAFAVMGALAQVNDDTTGEQSNLDEN